MSAERSAPRHPTIQRNGYRHGFVSESAAIDALEVPHVRPVWAPLTLIAFVVLVICSNIASGVWARWIDTNPEGLLMLSSRNRYLALTLAAMTWGVGGWLVAAWESRRRHAPPDPLLPPAIVPEPDDTTDADWEPPLPPPVANAVGEADPD